MKKAWLGMCFILVVGSCVYAQESYSIQPDWQKSFGNHLFTSRDSVTHAVKDRDGNLIMAIATEADSSFCDILVRKYAPAGTILWEYRFSSGLGIDYDMPAALLVDRFDDVYLIGYARTIYYDRQDGLFALKLSKTGALVWQRTLAHFTNPNEWFYLRNLDCFLDDEANFYITFSGLSEFHEEKPTYIHAYKPDGSIIRQDSISGVEYSNSGGSVSIKATHDLDGNFVFSVLWADTDLFQFRRVNPRFLTDETTTVSMELLSDSIQSMFFGSLSGNISEVYHGFNGHTYLAGNTEAFSISRFGVLDIDEHHIARYLYLSPVWEPRGIQHLQLTPQGQLLVTGWEDEQIPGHPAAFIWVLDQTGTVVEAKTIEPPGGFIPSYFVQEQGEYLVSGALANSGLGFIQALDVEDLTETWSYTLSTPADKVFSGIAPVVVDSNLVYLPGNLLRHKFPNLNLYAYQNAFVAAINPLQQEEIWQHRSSAVGLSYVDVYWHGIDRKGDLVVFTTEFKAPDDTLPYFPASSTMYKCSTDGTLLWWRLLAPDWGAAPNAFTSPVFDLQNNIIFPLVHQSNGATYLAKWSETGQFIDSFKFDAYWMKLDAQHHLLLAGGNGINHVGFLLNDQFDILKSQTLSGYPIESFILPGHAGSYAYVYEKQDVFPYQAIFKMYHDWDLVWERSIPLVGPYNSGMNKSMVDPVTGDLIFLASYTTNASGQLMYRLSFNGELNQIPFDGTTTDVIQMHCLKNRNFFLRRANTVECYDSTGLLINSVPFSAIYGHHSFVFGDWFFYFRSDSLGHWQISAFDAQGNYRYLFDCGKWLNYTLLTNTMDSTYAYYAPNFLGGNVWVGGPWFVRKWQRAVVSKFSLNHFLTVSAHSPDDKGVQLTCIPNPANDAFRIELPQGIGINDVRWMEALSADGRLMCQTTGMPTDQTVVCTAWPSGCYWVRVICEDGRVFSSSVVKPE